MVGWFLQGHGHVVALLERSSRELAFVRFRLHLCFRNWNFGRHAIHITVHSRCLGKVLADVWIVGPKYITDGDGRHRGMMMGVSGRYLVLCIEDAACLADAYRENCRRRKN
jgi:hypothetical protein